MSRDAMTFPGIQRGLYVRFAESDPQATDGRGIWMEAHKAYLRQSFGEGFKILLSGPMQPGDGGAGAALVIAEAPSLAAFIAFSEGDPFVINRVYNHVRILHWTPTLMQAQSFALA